MDGNSPEPQPYDPAQSEAPPLSDDPAGGFVLLVAASGAADRDWAERSATSLAEGWARRGRRILLADLSLMQPGLHRVLGVENREGVTDTFLFGSSIQKVARPVRERGFLFVSAGTATARPDAVTGSSRWASVVDGCARVHATLVVFLPSDLPGGETLLDRASDVVLLTDASASGGAALAAGLGERLRAVLVPPRVEAEAAHGAENGDGLAIAEGAGYRAAGAVGEPPFEIETQPDTSADAALTDALPLLGEPTGGAPDVLDIALPPMDGVEAAEEPTLPTIADVEAAEEPPLPTIADVEPSAETPLPSFGDIEVAPAEPAPAAGDGIGMTLEEAEAALSAAEAQASAAPPAAEAPAAADEVGGGFSFDIGEPAAPSVPAEPSTEAEEPVDVLAGLEFGSSFGLEPEQGETAPATGGLSFIPPEEPAAPAEAPLAEPSWAESQAAGGMGGHAGMPAGGGGLRADDLPTRETRPEPPRERERPKPSSQRPAAATAKPAAKAAAKPARKSSAGTLLLLLLLVAGGAVGAHWYGLVEIPYVSPYLSQVLPPRTGAATTAGPASPGPAAGPAPEAAAAPINEFAYALTLDSFTDPTPPKLQAASLNAEKPELLFVVSPVAVNGTVYYRLLAGPAADSAGGEALRATLRTVLTRENPSKWVMRPTPLAFNLGDRDELAAAAERIAELSRVDIPAYVLELPGRSASGARAARYRVYGGAYADEQEARYFKDLLAKKGFPDAPLVPRIGRHIQ